MGLVSRLPEGSFARKKLTASLVDQLWDSLQHPPLCYVGDKYQYRQPDGSSNVGSTLNHSSAYITVFIS